MRCFCRLSRAIWRKCASSDSFGETNPSGKLAVSIPDENGQLPVYYNYREAAFQRDYTDCSGTPRYGFGYGLSYAEFMLKESMRSMLRKQSKLMEQSRIFRR